MSHAAASWTRLQALRQGAPLVHNITNFVAMEVVANCLLALGAAPAMVHAEEEVEDFVAIASALVINIGTLSPPWVAAMERAALRARTLAKPWVLDPVGCGATPYRTTSAAELAGMQPAVIRGNASEIATKSSTSSTACTMAGEAPSASSTLAETVIAT